MNLVNKEVEADALVKAFKSEFFTEFKIIPEVTYRLPEIHIVSLELIRAACEIVLEVLEKKRYERGIKTVAADPSLLLLRHLFCKVALDLGHKPARVSRFLGLSGSLAKYGRGRSNTLIASGDVEAVGVYDILKREIDRLAFENINRFDNQFLDKEPF